MKRSVVLVDDDETFAYALASSLLRADIEVQVARNLAEADKLLEKAAPSLVLIDHQLPDGTGLALAQRLAQGRDDGVATLMITAFGSIDGAVQAMKAGCVDYVTKERDFNEILLRVRKALELVDLRTRVARYEQGFARHVEETGIDGESAAVRALRQQIRSAAAAPDTTVLILGESGTGKQLVARAIHAASERRDRPYVEVDCTTLTTGLMESELFGHERGAFTGAVRRKLGLVEMAGGGSLLLDEIGDLDPSSQGKLLRLLQERRFRRVGSVVDREVDVRILAATNRVLEKEVARGRFRDDLYYRLRVFVVPVPPLRERGDDVVLLAERFVREFGRRLGKPEVRLAGDAISFLRSYPFPGNVRELRAIIEQAMVKLRGAQLEGSLFGPIGREIEPRARPRGRPRETITAEEAAEIRRAMERHFGNQSKAAAALGMSRFALKRKLERLQEQVGEEDDH